MVNQDLSLFLVQHLPQTSLNRLATLGIGDTMYISPMLLHKSDVPISHPDLLAELKLDGIRLTLSTCEGRVQLYTRHETPCTMQFPELHNLVLPEDTVLDGELIVTDTDGKPEFESAMKRFSTKGDRKIQSLLSTHPVQFVVFDILIYQGENVTSQPLYQRRELLHKVISEQGHLSFCQGIEGQGEALFHIVQQQKLEGIVLKKLDSPYEIGRRSYNWLKVIDYTFTDVLITGIRKEELGYRLSFPDRRYAGIMELPLPPNDRKALWSILSHAKIDEDEKWIHLNPIRCKVKSRGLTKQGYLRIPVFQEFLF